jgi:DHHC palmitoyltransferase
MNRHLESDNPDWIWNDQALTYRPLNAKYDSECACVIEGFDHTCPWTGTAIAKKNMLYFRVFVILVFTMLFVDFVVLTLGFVL